MGRAQGPASRASFLQRVGPVGGWFPYGGGLLHWWDPHCFPRWGGPDDYCHKNLPPVCWPPYLPWYLHVSEGTQRPCQGSAPASAAQRKHESAGFFGEIPHREGG